jgi:hypothetical protein
MVLFLPKAPVLNPTAQPLPDEAEPVDDQKALDGVFGKYVELKLGLLSPRSTSETSSISVGRRQSV